MQFVPWASLLLAGVAGGCVTCAAMVVPRRYLPAMAVAGTGAAIWAVATVFAIWRTAGRIDASIASVFIALGACAGGYALASSIVPSLTKTRPAAPKFVVAAETDDAIRVVLLADAEYESYDPSAVTTVMQRFDDAGVPLPPDYARPLVYASERARYRQAGRSPAREQVRAVAVALQARLAGEDVAGHVEVAFCTGRPSLADVVARMAAQGTRRIVVAGLTVAWTRAFDAAVSEATTLGLASAGIVLETTDPSWASPHIAAMVAQRTLSALGGDGASDGVVLVSEGEPWQACRDNPAATEQETFFVQRVRAELVDAGIATERIRRAWLEWEEPDVSEAVRHLAAVGARRIALAPVSYPVETIGTLIDLKFAADRAANETGASTIVLDAWGDDPSVVETLREGVVAAAGRFEG